MERKPEGYYELLEIIEKQYPGKAFLKPKEIASIMGCDIKTVIAAMNKRYNALPFRNISAGIKNKSYVTPVSEFIRWAIKK